MKRVITFLLPLLFILLYYFLWAIMLPIGIVQLFISVAADDDDGSSIVNSQRG